MTRTVQVTNKDVNIDPDGKGGFEVTIKLTVRYGRTDSEEVNGPISAKGDKEIPQVILDDVAEQARYVAERFLAAQAEYNFDLLDFHEAYRRKQGYSISLADKPMSEFPVKLTVKVDES